MPILADAAWSFLPTYPSGSIGRKPRELVVMSAASGSFDSALAVKRCKGSAQDDGIFRSGCGIVGWSEETADSMCGMSGGYVYILGSSTGTLYIGVTSDIYHRIQQHRNGAFEGFSKTYGCTRLLYVEPFELMLAAIAREKQLKGWRREKKLDLIRKANPEFKDLAATWGWQMIGPNERMRP